MNMTQHELTADASEAARLKALQTGKMKAATIAWLSFFIVPALGAATLWHFLGSKVASAPNVWVGAGFVMVSGVLLLYGIAVCSVQYWGLSLLGLIAAGIYGGLSMVGIAVTEALLVLCGMHIAFFVNDWLAKLWEVSPEAAECRHKRNPRCSTCHAKTFCPHQPGGIADKYKKQPVIRLEQETSGSGD